MENDILTTYILVLAVCNLGMCLILAYLLDQIMRLKSRVWILEEEEAKKK